MHTHAIAWKHACLRLTASVPDSVSDSVSERLRLSLSVSRPSPSVLRTSETVRQRRPLTVSMVRALEGIVAADRGRGLQDSVFSGAAQHQPARPRARARRKRGRHRRTTEQNRKQHRQPTTRSETPNSRARKGKVARDQQTSAHSKVARDQRNAQDVRRNPLAARAQNQRKRMRQLGIPSSTHGGTRWAAGSDRGKAATT